MSKIQWTGETWNPVVGCSIKSPGCRDCYAMKEAYRFGFNPKLPQYHGLTVMTKAGPVWTGELQAAGPTTWYKPFARKKPTTFFVNSMGDFFHEKMLTGWIDSGFAVMRECPRHTFQILTKRADRMRLQIKRLVETGFPWPLPNVHLGVSVERQEEANERIPHLLQTPAAVRFVSYEPALELIDLTGIRWWDGDAAVRANVLTGEAWVENSDSPSAYTTDDDGNTRLDWVIIGGESGANARPFDIDWARSVIRQCQIAGVPVFMKQLGSNPYSDGRPMHARPKGKYGDPAQWPPELRVRQLPTPHQGAPA